MSINIKDKAIISFASAMVSLSVFSQSTDQNYLMDMLSISYTGNQPTRGAKGQVHGTTTLAERRCHVPVPWHPWHPQYAGNRNLKPGTANFKY